MVLNVDRTTRLIRDGEKGGGGEGSMEVGEQRVDVYLADFIYVAFSRMLGNSYRSRYTSFM